jgi:hypothetical protein
MLRIATALLALAVLLARPSPSAAQGSGTPPRATIVRIDGSDVFLDVGRDALAGARRLTVYRRVVVRHPLTRKSLEDRFAIGELEIVQAGDTLTLARPVAPPAHPFSVGDRAELIGVTQPSGTAPIVQPGEARITARSAEPGESVPAPPSANASAATATATIHVAGAQSPNAEGEQLLRYFQATLAQPPAQRIRIYEAYVLHHPRSRYRAFIEQEVRYLRALQASVELRARDDEAAQRAALLASAVELLPPEHARAGVPLAMALRVRPEAHVRGLSLHVRPMKGELFQTIAMSIDARGHAHATVPAELARAPGFAFFIEAVNDRGETAAAFASARTPHAVKVKAPRVAPERRRDPLMRVRFSSELASFDGTSGRDYFLINEGDFFYRVRYGHLYGVRMGYGRFDGEGGTVEELDVLGLDPRPAGFTYAYLEGEFALTELIGLSLRGTLGLGRPDSGEQGQIGGGFQTRLRLGDPNGTNLVIAGELVPEIGQRALLHLGWELIDRVPMAAEVQVTDQPVNSDELAVRIVYELGYRVTERIALALRPSYQLRTIRHAGPGMGLSATFDW